MRKFCCGVPVVFSYILEYSNGTDVIRSVPLQLLTRIHGEMLIKVKQDKLKR